MRRVIVFAACAVFAAATSAFAASSVSLDFEGNGNSLADTGFESVYNINTDNFTVGGGMLSIQTQSGDIFGRYEAEVDPDDARNVFYSSLDPLASSTVTAKINVNNLNENFHGGGIWLGTDEDHYIRLGVIHNSFEGGLIVEALRENEDIWRGGQPGDIIGVGSGKIADARANLDVFLKLERSGGTATAWWSLDGLTYNQVGGLFDGIVTEQGSSPYIEGGFKVGVYAFGGPDQQDPGIVSFYEFNATSVVPEPSSLAVLALGLLPMLRRRKA